MFNVDQIRLGQEQRLLPVLKAWDEAKTQLESAIALAKAREREFQDVSEDVRRKLDALDLVTRMANGLENEITTEKRGVSASETRPALTIADEPNPGDVAEGINTSIRRIGTLLGKSSRPLFSPVQRSA